MIRILIAVPTARYIETETFGSIYGQDRPDGAEISFASAVGYEVAFARNKLVDGSLMAGFDYTFFVDADIVLPSDALKKLLNANADVATGWYVRKTVSERNTAELYKSRGFVNLTDIPDLENYTAEELRGKSDIIDVAACGLGCALIKNSVFTEYKDSPVFRFIDYSDGVGRLFISEDIHFCNKIKKQGKSILCDASVQCAHIGREFYT